MKKYFLILFLIAPMIRAGEVQCYEAHKKLKAYNPRWVMKVYKEPDEKFANGWMYTTGPKKKPDKIEQLHLQNITEQCARAGMGRFYRGNKDGRPTHYCYTVRIQIGGGFGLQCNPSKIKPGKVGDMVLL